MKRILFSLVIIISSVIVNAGGNQGGGCPPGSPCWCVTHPNSPGCPPASNIPIDEHYWVLIIGGMLMGGYVLYKKKLSTESE